MIAVVPVLVAFLGVAEPEIPGVTIRIWHVGETMSDIYQVEPGQLPNDVAVIPSLDMSDSTAFLGHADHFILLADGSIVIDQPGVYEFKLTSDDGSELWIAGNQVIDHGGLHGMESLSGHMALEAGLHPFQVKYFDNTGDAMLQLAWKQPLAPAFTIIPEASLRTSPAGNVETSKGRKSIVRERLNRYPGHGAPLEGVHPGLQLKRHAIKDLDGRVTAMDWLDDGQMILLTDAGTLWAVGSQWATQKPYLWIMAEGMDDPGGLVVADDGIWVIQREELTRLNDLDGDGRIDDYRAMATGWPVAGADAGRARGLVESGDDFLTMLTRARNEHGEPIGSEHRGTVLRISRDGSWDIVAEGLVEPECFIQGFPHGNAFLDNDAAGGVAILDEGRKSLDHQGIQLRFFESNPKAACWIGSGPWRDQLLVADGAGGGLWRLRFDPHDEGVQGSAFRASQGLGERLECLAIGPGGDAWILGRDQDGTSLNRLSDWGTQVFEISGIRAHANGLEVNFTHRFDPLVASDPASWLLLSSSLAGQGAPGLVAELKVTNAFLLPGGRSVFLEVPSLRDQSMIHLQLVGPWSNSLGDMLYSNEAWYTMYRVPSRLFIVPAESQPGLHNVLTPREEAEGWILLFDGESTSHWRGFGKDHMPAGWTATDGTMMRSSSGGDIITREQFDDFELTLDWRVEAGGNSGVFFNVTEDGHSVWLTGPEMQILDNPRHQDGRNPLTSAGSNYALHAPTWDMTGPPGAWNRARIILRGDEVEHWLNGVRIVDYVLGSPEWERRVADSKFRSMPDYGRRTGGHIALQDHGDVVSFRNIKIRRLGVSSDRTQ